MKIVSVVAKFVTQVAIPTGVDVVAAMQKDSEGGRKITPPERDEILSLARDRITRVALELLPTA